ncbi:MAG: class I SAM-dependent methyltransferase [Elusimicrobiota bacterium]
MALTHVPCLCGADDTAALFHRPYGEAEPSADFLATTDRFENYGRVVRCRSCGLVYTDPRPEDSFLLQGYADSADTQYAEEAANRSINAYLSLNTIRRFLKGGRLLDVGCALGYFLNAARVDFEVTGVEPSVWAADQARSRFKVEVRTGTLLEQSFPDGSFDAVTMIDVLEHLGDPASMLDEVRRVLKPGGLLYLVTPDIDSLSARLLRGYWWGLRPAHLYYFSRRTLDSLLRKKGFDPALSHSFGRIFSYGYWASRLASYPALVRKPVETLVSLLGFEHKILYLDTRDSMEVVAVRRD